MESFFSTLKTERTICELREAKWQIKTDERPDGETCYVLIAPPEAQMKLGV